MPTCVEWTDEQLQEAGLLEHKKQIKSIGGRLERICKEMQHLGLRAFVDATHHINIHHQDRRPFDTGRADQGCVILTVDGPFDGGDW